MAEGKTLELVVWRLGAQRYALPLAMVERVLPAAEVTPLPDAPAVVTGILNVQGRIVPVVDLRRRLGQPQRELQLADQIVLARTARRVLAFAVDSVQGVVDHEAQSMVDTREVSRGPGVVSGVIKLPDGLVARPRPGAFVVARRRARARSGAGEIRTMTLLAPPDTLLRSFSDHVAGQIGLSLPPARWPDLLRATTMLADESGLPDAQACMQRARPSRAAPVERRLQHRRGALHTRDHAAALLPDAADWVVTLLGTDIHPGFLEHARRGIYGDWSFRGVAGWVQRLHFEAMAPGRHAVRAKLRHGTDCRYLNLAAEPGLDMPAAMDVVLCRHVLMYFDAAQAARAMRRLRGALPPRQHPPGRSRGAPAARTRTEAEKRGRPLPGRIDESGMRQEDAA